MNKTFITAVIVLIVGVGVGFFGGMKYQQSKSPIRQFGNFGGRNTGSGNNTTNAFRPISGQILSTSDNSLTVKIQDGSSKIIILSDKTQIDKAASASASDLQVGSTVAVFGLTNSDGSVTAQSVQLNPTNRDGSPLQGQ